MNRFVEICPEDYHIWNSCFLKDQVRDAEVIKSLDIDQHGRLLERTEDKVWVC